MADVIALKLGQYRGVLKYPGQKFHLVKGDECPSWASPDAEVEQEVKGIAESHDEITKPLRIQQAVEKLDVNDDELWTTTGKPKVKAVEEILGFDITAEELKSACPDASRD